MSKSAPKNATMAMRICCLTEREGWTSPLDGEACTSRRHGHMSLGHVERLINDGKMEMVHGFSINRRGEEVPAWIPAARFINARRWRKTLSFENGSSVAVMQLVRGG